MLQPFSRFYLHQQFFPGILSVLINPFYFIRKNLLKQIQLFAKDLNGRLLDFGCGSKPYLSLFSHVDEYVGVDMKNEGHDHQNEDIDVYYDGKNIPFGDNTFDSILASEVLEHVPDVDESLSELWRVLKMEGKILITVPFVWSEHEMPYDFRRFSVNGLEKVLTDNGFEVIRTQKSGTFLEVVTQMGMMYLHSFLYTRNKYLNLVINGIFIFPSCLFGCFWTWILPKKRNLYFNVVALAKKVEK